METTVYWLKLCDLICFYSLRSFPNPHLTCHMILFSCPTRRENVKALSAPVNQKGPNKEFYEARSASFERIFSKRGPACKG